MQNNKTEKELTMSGNYSSGNEQMYLFLVKLGDWQKRVDQTHGNNDGSIIKSELRRCVKEEFNDVMNTNLDVNKLNDMVDQFFITNDTNNNYNKVSGTDLVNYNLLDANEIQNMTEAHMAKYQIAKDVLNGYLNNTLEGIEFPFPMALGTKFKEAINELLLNIVSNTDLDAETLRLRLINEINQNAPRIAADCYEEMLIQEANKQLKIDGSNDGYNYNLSSYGDLSNEITSAVNNLISSGNMNNLTEIGDLIEQIIDDYVSLSLSDPDTLSNEDKEKDLTEMARVKYLTEVNKTIRQILNSSKFYLSYANEINKEVEDYINNLLSDATFGNIKDKLAEVADFKNSEIYQKYFEKYNDDFTPVIVDDPNEVEEPEQTTSSIGSNKPIKEWNGEGALTILGESNSTRLSDISYDDLGLTNGGVNWTNTNDLGEICYDASYTSPKNGYVYKVLYCKNSTFSNLYTSNAKIILNDKSTYDTLKKCI